MPAVPSPDFLLEPTGLLPDHATSAWHAYAGYYLDEQPGFAFLPIPPPPTPPQLDDSFTGACAFPSAVVLNPSCVHYHSEKLHQQQTERTDDRTLQFYPGLP